MGISTNKIVRRVWSNGKPMVIIPSDTLTQEKNIAPTKELQEVVADEGYILGKVNVEPIPSDYIVPSGEVTITEQGTFDVSQYKTANVTAPFEPKFAQLINGTLTKVTAEDLKGATKVNDYAFYNQKFLTNVELDNSILRIGTNAFNGCVTLQNINIPTSLVSISSGAFANTPSLKIPLYLSEEVQLNGTCQYFGFTRFKIGGIYNPNIANACFQNCQNLEVVELNEGVNGIGFRQSQYSKSGATFILPSTITAISNDAFGYSSISKVILKATTPPTMQGTSGNLYMPYYVPYESIEQYKVATNWTTGTYYPNVKSESDLAIIDTTQYTKACVIGNDKGIEDDNNYAIYNYTNGEWVKA